MSEHPLDSVDTQNTLDLHQSGLSDRDNTEGDGDDAEVDPVLRDDKNNSLESEENGTLDHLDATSGHAELGTEENAVRGLHDVTWQNRIATVSPALFRYRCGLYPY